MLHGGDLTAARARHGGGIDDWLDLSTGINPHAWPWQEGFPADIWTRLPSAEALDHLLEVARQSYRVPDRADIVVAPGTQALIQWLPVLAPQGQVAVVSPTYGEHAASWQRAGFAVALSSRAMPLPETARHLVIVSPNNPDGHLFSRDEIMRLADEIARRGGWLVIDESFIDVMPEATLAGLCATRPVVILRSFGKFYGLAGVRLGFLIANPVVVARVRAALGPWCVSGPALAIGAPALADGAWASAMCVRLEEQAIALDAVLAGAGFSAMGGTPLYRLVRHRAARRIHAGLAAQQIWVRCFGHDAGLLRFGLPPDDAALARLAKALAVAGDIPDN